MGLFLAAAGIAGAKEEAVVAALKAYGRGARMKLEEAKGDVDEREALVIAPGEPGRVTVVFPGDFMKWDEAAEFLSKELAAPVFSFHIHDGDLWMYRLFVKGKEVDRFNPVPDYWDEVDEDEAAEWEGDAGVIAKHWPGVEAKAVKKYLVRWDLDEEDGGKAYKDDEHEIGSDWQMTDFMRRLGLKYPDPGAGPGRRVYRFN